MKKLLVVGVIVLFLGLACAPSINANVSKDGGNEPPYPPDIDGPTYGEAGVEYDYTFVSEDPEADYIWYYIEWGDGNNTGWIGHYESGKEINRSHSWSVNGKYEIRAKAKDFWNESYWSVFVVRIRDNPLFPPDIEGQTRGKVGIEYNYSFVQTNLEGYDICYFIEWGDNITTGWTEYYEAGVEIIRNHTWFKKGVYTIKAKVKDIFGRESNWAYLEITMPKNQNVFLPHCLGRFPLLNKFILRFKERWSI
jgi:hypothetical protein